MSRNRRKNPSAGARSNFVALALSPRRRSGAPESTAGQQSLSKVTSSILQLKKRVAEVEGILKKTRKKWSDSAGPDSLVSSAKKLTTIVNRLNGLEKQEMVQTTTSLLAQVQELKSRVGKCEVTLEQLRQQHKVNLTSSWRSKVNASSDLTSPRARGVGEPDSPEKKSGGASAANENDNGAEGGAAVDEEGRLRRQNELLTQRLAELQAKYNKMTERGPLERSVPTFENLERQLSPRSQSMADLAHAKKRNVELEAEVAKLQSMLKNKDEAQRRISKSLAHRSSQNARDETALVAELQSLRERNELLEMEAKAYSGRKASGVEAQALQAALLEAKKEVLRRDERIKQLETAAEKGSSDTALKEEVQQLRKENARYKERVDKLERRILEDSDDNVAVLKRKLAEKERNIKELQGARASPQKLRELNGHLERRNEQFRDLAEKAKAIQTEATSLRQQLKQTIMEKQALERRVEELKAQKDPFDFGGLDEMAGDFIGPADDVRESELDIESPALGRINVSKQLSRTDSMMLRDLNRALGESSATLRHYSDIGSASESADESALSSASLSHQSSMARVNAALKRVQQRLLQREAELQTLRGDLTVAEDKAEQAQREVETLRKERDAATQQAEAANANWKQTQSALYRLEKKMSEVESKRRSAAEAVQTATKSSQSAALSALEAKLQQATTDALNANAELEKEQERLADALREKAELKADMKKHQRQLESEVGRLNEELQRERSEVSRLQQRVEKQKRELQQRAKRASEAEDASTSTAAALAAAQGASATAVVASSAEAEQKRKSREELVGNKYVIGLTGNIACGKSTVGMLLQELGASLVDADSLTHELQMRGTPTYHAIVKRFGEGVLDANRNINRRALGDIVFSDAAELAALERIMHPAVAEESVRRIRAAKSDVVVYEAIKLLEAGRSDLCNSIWVVAAPRHIQVERLMLDRGMTRAEAEKRVDSQPAQADKLRRATVVIENGDALALAKKQVDRAWRVIPGVAPPRPLSSSDVDARLFSLDANQPHWHLPRGGCLSLGRAKDNDMVVSDPTVSAYQCRVFYDDAVPGSGAQTNYWVEDLSSNGTYINQRKLGRGRVHRLCHGDTLWLSKASLKTKPKTTKYAYLFQLQRRIASVVRRARVPASAEDALPPGWKRYASKTQQGKSYYVNTDSKETTWQHPNIKKQGVVAREKNQ